MKRFEPYIPYLIPAIMALYLVSKAIPPSPKAGEMDLYSAGKICVQEGGRVKPLDSVGRYSLLVVSSKQEFVEGKDGDDDAGPSWLPIPDFGKKREPAIRWILDTMAGDPKAMKHKVIRIVNDQVLNLLKLEARPGSYRYSAHEIAPRLPELEEAAKIAGKKDRKKRDVFENKVLELSEHLHVFLSLLRLTEPGIIPVADPDGKWDSLAKVDARIYEANESNTKALAMQHLPEFLKQQGFGMEELQKIPVEQRMGFLSKQRDKLQLQLLEEIADEKRPDESPQAEALMKIFRAYRSGDAKTFNDNVAFYHDQFDSAVSETDRTRVRLEVAFNHFSPFYLCGALYIMVGILGVLAWLGWTDTLRRSALNLMVLTFVVHTAGLISRMIIQGRPPVTNLHSSAVFIGWGAIALCSVLEFFNRNSVGNVVGAVVGFATMRIAYHLGGSGDSFDMMEAVLDTNLWLSTHVTIVTLGYTATFVAGNIGIYYVLRGIFTKSLDAAASKRCGQMIYGVLCFATFLSFTGTVLGGIWADQSWGRFWGWDAKENGAVLVVIGNVLILHARWSGMVKIRGMAVLAIFGNIVTAWSWFGTNQLGAGLHAYGFNNSLAEGCRYYWLSMLALIALGSVLPQKYWRSFSEDTVLERAQKARMEKV